MNKIQIWQGPNGIGIPTNLQKPSEIVAYANRLTPKQQNQIINAFKLEAFDMAAEYAWKKAMAKLKKTLAGLGGKFIGEMLGRDDIDEFTPIEQELTDYNAIRLAEQLGVIGKTAAIKLRQADELISHFFTDEADEEIDYGTAFQIVRSSVDYILGIQDISVAIQFSNFRDRLLSETLKADDEVVDQIMNISLFYLRTINTVLLSSIKYDQGAKFEHAINNFNLIIHQMWEKLAESDKWNIGMAYRDVTADGNIKAVKGLKNALLKVNGFDFVPENLRSLTFKKAAKDVIDIHFAFNNFYNEPAAVKKLANLGTTIPTPALIDCIQAYLVVYLGNAYGHSHGAAPIAENELSKIASDKWEYYFKKVIQTDETILWELDYEGPVKRFSDFLNRYNLDKINNLPKDNAALYNSIIDNNFRKVKAMAYTFLDKIK